MARKLRLEFPGACYHVINRCNPRDRIFDAPATKSAFEECLLAACSRCGWRLHAYVLMADHYHLAVETPQANLAAGMQWLQSTLANRLYRAGLIKGGVFERRYKALLIEPGVTLGKVCHYIDLNPVRAGIIPVARLRDYRFGSYRYLWHRSMRPNSLYFEAALAAAGNLPDTPDGWQAYERYLAWQAERGPAGRNPAYQKLSRGWVIGSKTFRHEQAERHRLAGETGTEGLSTATVEARERKWAAALETALADVASDERADARKSAPWKVAIAVKLKAQTDVTNRWLAEKLSMGSPIYVSKHVGLAQRRVGGSNGRSALSAQGNTWPLEADEDRLPVTLL